MAHQPGLKSPKSTPLTRDRAALEGAGGRHLEPMPGRPMKSYASLPDWQARSDDVREWGGKALAYVAALPPKKK